MASGNSALVRHYDKFVALLCLALLGAVLYFWLNTKNGVESAKEEYAGRLNALKPVNPTMGLDKVNADMLAYSNAFARIGKPFKMSFDAERKTGFFVPEKRIWCARGSCQAPIPPDAKVCPRCGTEQPGKATAVADASLDSDGDGLPDVWERKYGLNPLDPADASLDSDGDGFSNLMEFKAGTDPLDKNSHTDKMTLVRVKEIKTTRLPVKFMNTNLLPDGSYKCQFNYFDAETRKMVSLMIKEGDLFGPLPAKPGEGLSAPKRYADFKLAKLDWREETVVDKFTKKEKLDKVPVAIVERVSTGRAIEFRKEVEATDTDYKITFVQTLGNEEVLVEGGEGEKEFSIEGKVFLVKKVDKSAQSVVIVCKADNKEFTIPQLEQEDADPAEGE